MKFEARIIHTNGDEVPIEVTVDGWGDTLYMPLELAEELVKLFSYTEPDYHVVDFREYDWTVQHPLSCRPELFKCPYNNFSFNPQVIGKYRVELIDGKFTVKERV